MKLTDILLLSLSAALVIIGTHQTFIGGIAYSYPIFMMAVALLFWYKYRKNKNQQPEPSGDGEKLSKKNKKRK